MKWSKIQQITSPATTPSLWLLVKIPFYINPPIFNLSESGLVLVDGAGTSYILYISETVYEEVQGGHYTGLSYLGSSSHSVSSQHFVSIKSTLSNTTVNHTRIYRNNQRSFFTKSYYFINFDLGKVKDPSSKPSLNNVILQKSLWLRSQVIIKM